MNHHQQHTAPLPNTASVAYHLQRNVKPAAIEIRAHARERMAERGITERAVRNAIVVGDVRDVDHTRESDGDDNGFAATVTQRINDTQTLFVRVGIYPTHIRVITTWIRERDLN